MAIRAVVFDVGEVLVDETRQWGEWADWLGVSRPTFAAAFRDVIARGDHHRKVFEIVAPGRDIERETGLRAVSGKAYRIEPRDLYPDALPTLALLKAQGLQIGLAGNQPEAAEAALAECGFSADWIASSARWQVEKPSPEFFRKVIDHTGLAPAEIAYVGDRLDNDVLPAREAGLFAVFLERGPWGGVHAARPDAEQASARIHSLSDLPAVIAALA